jgi:hypothetical protein
MRTGARKPDEPKIIGASTAASILGVNQTNLRPIPGLPEPYDKDRATTMWREDEIRAFARKRARARAA